MPDATHDIPVADPLTNSSAAASVYALPPAVLAFATDRFAKRFPKIDQSLAYRALEVALTLSGEVPWMVYSHEQGHGRVGRNNGWDVDVTMLSPWSGITSYTPTGPVTADQQIAFETAGVNQEQLNALKMFRDWGRNGDTSYQEALAYLLAQTNLGLYAIRTSALAHPPDFDDINAYVNDMKAKGQSLTTFDLAAQATTATLLSAPFWAALVGGTRFLIDGTRRIKLPAIDIGGAHVTLPSFHYLLGVDSRVVGATTFVDWGRPTKIEVSVDERTDRRGGALGLRLDDIPIAPRVTASPFLRVTKGPALGVYTGTDIEFRLSDRLSLSGEVVYRRHDIRTQPEGMPDGLSFSGGLRARF